MSMHCHFEMATGKHCVHEDGRCCDCGHEEGPTLTAWERLVQAMRATPPIAALDAIHNGRKRGPIEWPS